MMAQQYIICSIWHKQYAYWMFLESKCVHPQVFDIGFEPLPEIFIGRN